MIEQNRNQLVHPTIRVERHLKQHAENVSHSSTKLHHVVENIKLLATKLAAMDTYS